MIYDLNFYEKYLVKKLCIFHLILVGIPCSLVLSVKNRGVNGVFLVTRQNSLSMKVICWWSLMNYKWLWLVPLQLSLKLQICFEQGVP